VESALGLCFFFFFSYLGRFATGFLPPCMCRPLHLRLRSSNVRCVKYMVVAEPEPLVDVAGSRAVPALMQNRGKMQVVRDTVGAAMD